MNDNQQRKYLHLKWDATTPDITIPLLLHHAVGAYLLVMYNSTMQTAIRSIVTLLNRMAFCMSMRCWCGANVQGVLSELHTGFTDFSFFFAIFDMEAPENTQEFFSIAFLQHLTEKRRRGLRQTIVNRLIFVWCQKELGDNMADCCVCEYKYNVVLM